MKFIPAFVILYVFIMCNNTDAVVEKPARQFEQISATSVSYTDLKLDSIYLDNYLENRKTKKEMADNIRAFYQNRGYQFAWFNEKGIPEHTQVFWDMHIQHINFTMDSSLYDKQLHIQVEDLLNEDVNNWGLSREQLRDLELQLTEHFFDYAKTAYTSELNPKNFNWHIPARKMNLVSMLDSLVAENSSGLNQFPKQYQELKNQVLVYRKINMEHSQVINNTTALKGVYKKGDSSDAISRIRKKLAVLGDLDAPAASGLFNEELEAAVKRFQQRHGLVVDGIIGPRFLKAFNYPIEDRIKQMLINLERMKWLPEPTAGKRLVANIPSFTLHVYEGNDEQFNMSIVVGKSATRTVIFNDKLEYIVFSPYWNIPRSIVRNEILPAMRSNSGYLDRNNMEMTGNSNGLPVIRQKPGPGNALGKVKFIFPNRYNIYFHDTPAKSLFERNKRAFSHGCIRLEEPFRLASYLLGDKTSWTDERIRAAMNSGNEKWVKLDQSIPVLICYFTTWVDASGKLHFREDIYGHDKRMEEEIYN